MKSLEDLDKWTGRVCSISSTYSLDVAERVALIVAGSTYTITLPSVLETQGLTYSIYYADIVNTDNITISCYGTEKMLVNEGGLDSSVVLNALGEFVLLYSDGYYWHIIGKEG